METAGFYREDGEAVMLFVRLTPKAAKNAAAGATEQADGRLYLNIHIRAVPENGQANKALIKFLSKALRIAAGNIRLRKGQTARFKQLELRGDKAELRAKLAELGG